MGAPQSQPKPSRLRFGVFEADLRTRELFKYGVHLRIQGQPFEILCALLERPGEVVSRQELRQRLWPADTFVEYEDSLNSAVRKLRAALCDSSDQPRYIETVARRGYRLVVPVAAVVAHSFPRTAPAITPSMGNPTRSASRRNWWLAAVVVSLTVVLAVTFPQPTPRLVRITPLTHSGLLHGNQKLLTDGPRLYFTERTKGRFVPKWMPATGGDAVPIPVPFFTDLQDISPDGSELVVRELLGDGRTELWTVSVAGGALHRLGIANPLAAAYTRDGRGLYYSRGAEVFVCDRTGGNRRRLLNLPGEVFGIRASPAGDRLRFYVAQDRSQGVVLWESASDGSNIHRVIDVAPFPRREWGGSWSSDGRWFVFVATRATKDLWLLGKAGLLHRQPTPVPLTAGPVDFVYPVFSRDGDRIFAVGEIRRGELSRYDFVTRRFTPFLGGIPADQLAFSPDHQWLAYVSYPQGQLWRARADASQAAPLTGPPMLAVYPEWSPDGYRIAFEARPAPGAHWNAYVISATGGAPLQVAQNTDLGGMTWLPDSKSLIIGNPEPNSPLRIVDLERHSVTPVAGTEQMTNPHLSHSGREVVVRTKDTDTLSVFDLVTRRMQVLATAADDIGYPEWSNDDRYVYFNRFLGTSPAFYRVRVADGFTERMMLLTQFEATGTFGTWTTLAPDGSLLLLRNLGGTDLYSIDWVDR